jgi:hypothetical protein
MITIGLLAVLFLTVYFAKRWVSSTAEDLTKNFVLANEPAQCKVVTDAEKQDFIKRQQNEIVKYADAHRRTAIEFYGYFYATFAVFSLFGFLSLISGVIIAKKGYDNANPHLIAVFLVSSAIVLLYQGFFGVFQQKVNVDNNAKLFTGYSKLLTKIDTYCSTGKIPVLDPGSVFNTAVVQPKKTPPGTDTPPLNNTTASSKPAEKPPEQPAAKPNTFFIPLEADEFINYVGWQMEQLKSFTIAFDDSKIVAISSDKMLVLPD